MFKQLLYTITIFMFFGGTPKNENFNQSTNLYSTLLYNVYTINKGEMSFGVSETRPDNSDFYINSNFFTTEASIGLVIIDRKRKSRRVKGGGFFYVRNGKPYVRAKKCPYMTEYSSQTILWGIDNGKVNEDLISKNHAKQKRYRTLMGQNSDGDIIIVSSNRIGFVTIKELLDFSKRYDIVDGILLDGGTSVDYKFSGNNGEVKFSSVPDVIKKEVGIKTPTTYIYGNFN